MTVWCIIILTPVIIIVEDRYLERRTFVHWLHLYIAPFVTAGSTLNMAGINLTYLL